ncbi:GNAT family N-acetyltransferase [Citrobacter sp. Cb004]|uniref:GNAT family N-acetyltransferase n=1 Tax=Citrobacter sp. Cb004 TaxID=2985006 RepID=UPI002577503B|nr:GNAT family N-acetyltransferase [Citrobacter sp. Cb004]MDM3359249.1 GNAT family N-acetyltransferase [Citrobacter sp. Cb004]
MTFQTNIVSPEERTEILDTINRWLHEQIFPYKRPSAQLCEQAITPVNAFRIITNKKKFDLYFRFGQTWVKHEEKTIVIARTGFENQRNGHGTSLLKVLTEIAKKYRYNYIAIESVNSNSRAFALNFGFEEHIHSSNYYVSTDKLKSKLSIR